MSNSHAVIGVPRMKATIQHPDPNDPTPMSVESREGSQWPPPLVGRLSSGESAQKVADTVVDLWLQIDQALHPIIGRRGVTALFNRSMKVTGTRHPWLMEGHQHLLATIDVETLRATFAKQAGAEAAAGGSALFHTFHELLASLVGAALTNQLLGSVWARPAGPSPAQDTSQ